MEIAPELQFKHYTVAEARLPADALMHVPGISLSEVAICCDLERHVFHAAHTDDKVAEALRISVGTVMSRLFYARQKLRAYLAQRIEL